MRESILNVFKKNNVFICVSFKYNLSFSNWAVKGWNSLMFYHMSKKEWIMQQPHE